MTLHHSLALEMAVFLAWNPSRHRRGAGRGGGSRARTPQQRRVSEGATVYDGDRFSTDPEACCFCAVMQPRSILLKKAR